MEVIEQPMSATEKPETAPRRGVSLSSAERLLAVAVAVVGPLYPVGLLFLQRRLETGAYALDSATARHATLLLPTTNVVVLAVEALIAPWALFFALFVGFTVVNAAVLARQQALYESLIESTDVLKDLRQRRNRLRWGRWRESFYPYLIVFQTVTGLSVLLLSAPAPWVLLSGLLAVASAYLIVRGWGGKPPFADWLLAALLCAYLASLVPAYYWPSTATGVTPSVTVAVEGGNTIEGGLLTHADGYWYLLVKSPTEPVGRLLPIPDDQAKEINVSSRSVGPPQPRRVDSPTPSP